MKDYTQLPLETKIDGGVVEVCPYCKRVGLATENSGLKSYCHMVWTILDGDTLITKWDSCPNELPKDVKPKPKDIID